MYGLRGMRGFGDAASCGPQPSVSTDFNGLPNPSDQVNMLHWLACMAQGQQPVLTAPTGPGYVLPAPPTVTATLAPPSLSFINRSQMMDFTNGGVFQVGDQWQAGVSNVAKNQPVTVHAIHDGVDAGSAVVGNTGDAGLFTLNGSMDPSTVGKWDETWTVPGGFYSAYLPNVAPLDARLSFTVQGPAAPPPAPPAPPKGDGSSKTSSSTSTGFDLSAVPWWAWAGGAAVAFFAFGGGRHGR